MRRISALGALALLTLGLFSVPGLSIRTVSANTTPYPPGYISPLKAAKDYAHEQYLLWLRARNLAAAQAKAAAERAHAQKVATSIWSREGKPALLAVIGPTKVLLVQNGALRQSQARPPGPLSVAWLARNLPAPWASYAAGTASAQFGCVLAVTDGTELDASPADIGAVRLADGAAIWVSRGTFHAGAVAISSYDPATGGILPATDTARPFIRAGLGATLALDGTVIAGLGNGETPDESGVTWGKGATGHAAGVTVSGNYTGMRLASSRAVALNRVLIAHAVGDGLVLENDGGTVLSSVTSADNGRNGIRLGFGPDHRRLSGIATIGNGGYGLSVIELAGLNVVGFASFGDGEGGIRLARCTGCTVVGAVTKGDRVGLRVDAQSFGTSVIGGRFTGGDTGIDTGAAIALSGTVVTGAAIGLHADAGTDVRASRISIEAQRVGAHIEPGGRLLLTASTVLGPVGIKGRVVYSGRNTVALPPFPWLGIVAIAAIVLGLLLETVHALRQTKRIATRDVAPDHVLNTA